MKKEEDEAGPSMISVEEEENDGNIDWEKLEKEEE